ncbi:MAG: PAS domain S-box protein [Bdellovibrionota bacterium]
MNSKIKALIVENSNQVIDQIVRELNKTNIKIEHISVATETNFHSLLDRSINIIFCSYQLESFNSTQALKILQERGFDIPFIIISGESNEEIMPEMLRMGATDYLHKDRLGRLGPATIAALKQKDIRNEYKAILDASLDPIISIDHKGDILQWNKAAEDVFGFKCADVLHTKLVDTIIPKRLRQQHLNGIKKYLETGASKLIEKKVQIPALHASGEEIQIEIFIKATNHTHNPPIFTASARDLGEQLRSEILIKRNESRLRQVIEATPNGIIMVDRNGKITLCNAEIESLFGYSRNELIGKNVEILIPEKYRERHPEDRKNYFKNPETRQMGSGRELFGLRKNGVEVPLEIGLNPLETEEGMFVLASVVDISTRKNLEERFKQVVEATPTGILMVDQKGIIALLNGHCEALFGYTHDELVGKHMEVLVPHRFREAHSTHRQKFFESPETRQMGVGRDLFGLRKDGEEFPIEIGLNPMMTNDGTYVLASIVDITKRKVLENNLLQSSNALKEKNEEMEQFVYTVTHDLKSPLVTSTGFLGFLRQDIEAKRYDKLEDSLFRLERANKRMEQLINDLLQLSRVGRLEVNAEEIACNEVVSNVLENLASQIEEVGANVMVQNLPTIVADKKRLYQAIENLVLNALKYGRNKDEVEIEIGSRTDDYKYTKLFIKDHGPGIDPKYHEKVFALFQRLENSSESPEGTGVGLAIVARIMQVHHGKAWVESKLGDGATFILAFPNSYEEREHKNER